jgi:hypothetical protein
VANSKDILMYFNAIINAKNELYKRINATSKTTPKQTAKIQTNEKER